MPPAILRTSLAVWDMHPAPHEVRVFLLSDTLRPVYVFFAVHLIGLE